MRGLSPTPTEFTRSFLANITHMWESGRISPEAQMRGIKVRLDRPMPTMTRPSNARTPDYRRHSFPALGELILPAVSHSHPADPAMFNANAADFLAK